MCNYIELHNCGEFVYWIIKISICEFAVGRDITRIFIPNHIDSTSIFCWSNLQSFQKLLHMQENWDCISVDRVGGSKLIYRGWCITEAHKGHTFSVKGRCWQNISVSHIFVFSSFSENTLSKFSKSKCLPRLYNNVSVVSQIPVDILSTTSA